MRGLPILCYRDVNKINYTKTAKTSVKNKRFASSVKKTKKIRANSENFCLEDNTENDKPEQKLVLSCESLQRLNNLFFFFIAVIFFLFLSEKIFFQALLILQNQQLLRLLDGVFAGLMSITDLKWHQLKLVRLSVVVFGSLFCPLTRFCHQSHFETTDSYFQIVKPLACYFLFPLSICQENFIKLQGWKFSLQRNATFA